MGQCFFSLLPDQLSARKKVGLFSDLQRPNICTTSVFMSAILINSVCVAVNVILTSDNSSL